jgi:hypothetical protein
MSCTPDEFLTMLNRVTVVTKVLNGKFKSEDSIELDADRLEAQMDLRNTFPEVFNNG